MCAQVFLVENINILKRRLVQKLNCHLQLEKDRKELELLDKEMGQGKAELKLLHEAIQKRHIQLDTLDKDVEKEVNVKLKEIKVNINW